MINLVIFFTVKAPHVPRKWIKAGRYAIGGYSTIPYTILAQFSRRLISMKLLRHFETPSNIFHSHDCLKCFCTHTLMAFQGNFIVFIAQQFDAKKV